MRVMSSPGVIAPELALSNLGLDNDSTAFSLVLGSQASLTGAGTNFNLNAAGRRAGFWVQIERDVDGINQVEIAISAITGPVDLLVQVWHLDTEPKNWSSLALGSPALTGTATSVAVGILRQTMTGTLNARRGRWVYVEVTRSSGSGAATVQLFMDPISPRLRSMGVHRVDGAIVNSVRARPMVALRNSSTSEFIIGAHVMSFGNVTTGASAGVGRYAIFNDGVNHNRIGWRITPPTTVYLHDITVGLMRSVSATAPDAPVVARVYDGTTLLGESVPVPVTESPDATSLFTFDFATPILCRADREITILFEQQSGTGGSASKGWTFVTSGATNTKRAFDSTVGTGVWGQQAVSTTSLLAATAFVGGELVVSSPFPLGYATFTQAYLAR